MATFGYTSKGGDLHYNDANYIFACKFTCPQTGTAESISGYLYNPYAQCNSKALIYRTSDNGFVGITEQQIVALNHDDWVQHNFAAPKPDLTNQEYWLCTWASGLCRRYRQAGVANQHAYDAQTYDGYPNPLVPAGLGAYEMSIYCTYTPAGGGVTVKKGSNLASTMAQMLQSKMLFSQCNPYALRV